MRVRLFTPLSQNASFYHVGGLASWRFLGNRCIVFGLLNINKPKGATSRDAVNRVLWLARQVTGQRKFKVGHAGTLDPIATGVLVVCLGPATRLIENVQKMPKRYRGTFLLGRRSPSDDVELEAELLDNPPVPGWLDIEDACRPLTGRIEQTPPAYSAIKIDGKKAYDLARAGEAPTMKPRPVMIYSIEVAEYEYPKLVLDIECGSGTYIRAIGRDLAESLGTAAVMSELERTAIGGFEVEAGIDPSDLTEQNLSDTLISPEAALADLQRVDLTPDELEKIRSGQPIEPRRELTPQELAMFAPDGSLFAIGKRKRGGLLWPVRVFGG